MRGRTLSRRQRVQRSLMRDFNRLSKSSGS